MNNLLFSLFSKLLVLFPLDVPIEQKDRAESFTRDRILSIPRLICFIIFIVADSSLRSNATLAIEFMKDASRSGVWPDGKSFHTSSFSKAREKLLWIVFIGILNKCVALVQNEWRNQPWHTWHGMSVYAIDASKYTLPGSQELRDEFDPHSGLENEGKGHYPQCLVTTVFDVFRRLPIARTIDSIHCSEREMAKKLISLIPKNCMTMFDRGYPSYDIFMTLTTEYDGYFIIRNPISHTFKKIVEFIHGSLNDAIIILEIPKEYRKSKDEKTLTLRVLKAKNPEDGKVIVLVTNLLDSIKYTTQEIIDLYYERYRIEEQYRDEKVTLNIEKFHSETVNGIKQELMAAVIISLISRLLMNVSMEPKEGGRIQPQFKNAVSLTGAEIFILKPEGKKVFVAFEEFKVLLKDISRVLYYKPSHKRSGNPRINKHAPNKWIEAREKEMKKEKIKQMRQ